MPTITVKTVKQSQHPCGFCSTGNRHDLCPGGVLNGNLTEVVVCGCKEHPIEYRCLNCNERDAELINPDTWSCIDVDACEATVAKRRETVLRDLYGDRVDDPTAPNTPKAIRVAKTPAKPKTGTCICCGEATKGGLFLPGHDARHIGRVAETIKGGKYTLDEALQLMTEQGISEALRAKLAKRVAA